MVFFSFLSSFHVPEPSLFYKECNTLIFQAEKFFHLPTWKRGYHKCKSPKSEISCSLLIHAYNTVINWEKEVKDIQFVDNKIVDVFMQYGMGNAFYHQASGAVMALALNRSIFSRVNFTNDGLLFSKYFKVQPIPKNYKRKSKNLFTLEHWVNISYQKLLELKIPIKVTSTYPYFLLTDYGINEYVRTHFGLHFVYFLSNYFAYFNESIIEYAQKQFKAIPKSSKVLGIHVRKFGKNRCFINNIEFLKRVLVPFLDHYIIEEKPYIFFASNNNDYINYFQEKYSDRLFVSTAKKVQNGKRVDALRDIACLMMCDKLIGTFRSSFSTIAATRAMTNAYYLSLDVDYVFRFTSSQMSIFSMIYDTVDWNYMANTRILDSESYEDGARAFYYYFGI